MAKPFGRWVHGYHGCDEELARRVLLGEQELRPSTNHYDWLGAGIYFWENGPVRALQFATEEAVRDRVKIRNPSVLGAHLYLGNCFDLLDVEFTLLLQKVYPAFLARAQQTQARLPENRLVRKDGSKGLHALDGAVIEFAIDILEARKGRKFDTVRGAFWEGGPAFPASEISLRSHIQIAVRNPECVLGYFKSNRPLTDETTAATVL